MSEIAEILTAGEGGSRYTVGRTPMALYSDSIRGGRRKVSEIRAQNSDADGAPTQFDVLIDGHLWRSVNARFVEHVEFPLPPVPGDDSDDDGGEVPF